MTLIVYDFEIEYGPGKNNGCADALSRISSSITLSHQEETNYPVFQDDKNKTTKISAVHQSNVEKIQRKDTEGIDTIAVTKTVHREPKAKKPTVGRVKKIFSLY